MSIVCCGHCHEPVLPFGSLLLFDTHLAIDLEGSFVLLKDEAQADLDGLAIEFLRRAADGTLELANNLGRKSLTTRQTVIGTLVAVYIPTDGDSAGNAAGELDSRIRAVGDQALARERARRADVAAEAVSRWGKPAPQNVDQPAPSAPSP